MLQIPVIIQEENDDRPSITKVIDITDDNTDGPAIIDITANISGKDNNFSVPMVSQNAPNGLSLDLFKQYKRRVDFCDREIIKIHDKSVNKKDKGSKNNGLIYVDFQAGIFEALKINVVKLLKEDHGVKLIADLKV